MSKFEGNLRSRQVGYRYAMAVMAALASVVMTLQCLGGGLLGPSRYLLWIPLWVFFLGILQARSKTCAMLAAQGMCDCQGGMCPVAPDQLAASRKAAVTLLVRSMLYATLVCALILSLGTPYVLVGELG